MSAYKVIKKLLNKITVMLIKPPFVSVNITQIKNSSLLEGKRILITGGSRGIGLAMAKKFLEGGAKVLITGRSDRNLQEALKTLSSDKAYSLIYDASDINHLDDLISKCIKEMGGGLDIVVSNAGISLHEGNILNVTPEGMDKTFDINLKAHYFLAKAFIKYKVQNNQEGTILFVTSKDGAVCNEIPYGLTKASMNSLVGALSCHYYRKGIRINGIAPGVTVTDMTKSFAEREDGNMYASNYAGRNFIPEEVAEVANFLVSDASKCVTGQIFYCDGGDHLKSNIRID